MMGDKVFFLISSLKGGGAEAVCVNLANALSKKGYDVNVTTLNNKKSVYHNEISADVIKQNLNVTKIRYALPSLLKWIKSNKPEKVFVFSYEMAILLVLARYFSSHDFYIVSRNINNIDEKYKKRGVKGWLIRQLVSIFYTKSDCYINQCYAMEERFLNLFPSEKCKSNVIYNSLNSKFDYDFSHVEKIKLRQDTPFFLCVGRLSYQKSFSFALESFALFLKSYPDYKLIIIGEGELEDDLRRKVSVLNLEKSVIFKGFIRDLSSYYANAKAVLLTSKFEGFPNVLIESIAHATPVISLNCDSGPNEIIKNGVNGYLVENRSVSEFSEKMKLLINSDDLNSLDIYQTAQYYSIDNIVQQWEVIIRMELK